MLAYSGRVTGVVAPLVDAERGETATAAEPKSTDELIRNDVDEKEKFSMLLFKLLSEISIVVVARLLTSSSLAAPLLLTSELTMNKYILIFEEI
jgi:hypothetical protein